MNKLLKVSALAALVALGSSSTLLANSSPLTAGATVTPLLTAINNPAITVISENDAFSSPKENGYVNAYVLSGITDNPWDSAGGLTFVYQVYSDSTSIDSITGFAVDGWAGFQTNVAYYNYNGDFDPIAAARSPLIPNGGDTVGFYFTTLLSGQGAILPGYHSSQLVIYTDATSYTHDFGSIKDGTGASLWTLTAAVPDGGTTALLLGLGLLGLAGYARRK